MFQCERGSNYVSLHYISYFFLQGELTRLLYHESQILTTSLIVIHLLNAEPARLPRLFPLGTIDLLVWVGSTTVKINWVFLLCEVQYNCISAVFF